MSTKPTFLTQTQAQQRASVIVQKSIAYTFYLSYHKGATYQAVIDIQFTTIKQEDLFLDYNGSPLIAFYINGAKTEVVHDGLFITLPKDKLVVGKNSIQAYYENNYVTDGDGLHTFTDTDTKQYVYSNLEPYHCHKIFPCFDQPDLKATLRLISSAPPDWIQLFNENETKAVKNDSADAYKSLVSTPQFPEFQTFINQIGSEDIIQDFPASKLLSTYLFGFIAGPFSKVESKAPTHKNLPMRLYSRESLKGHLEKLSDFIFEVTNQAMVFYETFFHVDYPFSKYDQIFCPEYNMGAMENAGLVTFNDLYVFKEEVDASRLTGFANTITHELSHHWFGNLVTMRWWNDLWLNESFADFISHLCLSHCNIKSKKTVNIWVQFNTRKAWGYRTDQLSTTHPIAGEVSDTEAARNIFDGITYAKGASTLRQLLSLIGEESFGRAAGNYFTKFAWSNATLDDFIQCLDEEFSKKNIGFSLAEWKQEWICTAGLNEVQPRFDASSVDPQSKLTIVMTPALPEHPTLRRNKMKVAFIKEDGSITAQDVLLEGKSENVITYDGSQGYKAVMLNYEDEAFVKLLLDDTSIAFFKTNLHKIQDPLSKTLIWRSFFDMVRDGKLSSEEYIEVFVNAIGKETSDEIISSQYAYIAGALINFTPKKFQQPLAKKLFDFSLDFLTSTDVSNQNRIITIKKNIMSFVKDLESIKVVQQWYEGTLEKLKHIPLGLDNEWALVSLINRKPDFTLAEKEAIYNKQAAKDSSDTAKNTLERCIASRADDAKLEELWAIYQDGNQTTFSLRVLEYSQAGFNNPDRPDDLQKYYDRFWNVLLDAFKNLKQDTFKNYFSSLFPRSDDQAFIEQKLQEQLAKSTPEQTTFQKVIKEAIDDASRKRRAYECFYKRANLAK